MTIPIKFELVAPEQLLMAMSVEMVVVPGAEGNFGVLHDHSPFISAVRTGVIDVYESDQNSVDRRIFVSGGFTEVTPERCTVLADEAIDLDGANRAAAEKRLKDAQERLGDAETDEQRQAVQSSIAITEALVTAIAENS